MYICNSCGYGSAKWLGKCPGCGSFSTFEKTIQEKITSSKRKSSQFKSIALKEVKPLDKSRLPTGIFEFDRVLGGGFVPGSVILLTGEPGVGKSTLLLQSLQHVRTLYISGEESAEQVKERAVRMGVSLEKFMFSDSLEVESIVSGIEDIKDSCDIIVIDSIQTIRTVQIESQTGGVTHIRETTNALVTVAKKLKKTIIIIGHVTKEGDIAGPKSMEHMVDAVMNFEGERISQFRILRASKNRFGSTDEIGIFEMTAEGLQEVQNSTAFLEDSIDTVPGKTIIGVMEGKRPLFFEIQALASPTVLPMPRRVVKGVNYNKLLLLLAVLRKHMNIPLDKYDIYVNVIGGVDIKSTSADLGIVAAIYSSIADVPFSSKTVFTGEVGLLGEVRKVYGQDRIISEAKRLHFTNTISSITCPTIKGLKRK